MNMFQYTKVITQTGLTKVAIVIKVTYPRLNEKYCVRFLLLLEFFTKDRKAVHETIADGDGNHFGDRIIR